MSDEQDTTVVETQAVQENGEEVTTNGEEVAQGSSGAETEAIDLSKRVPRPNRDALDREIASLEAQIETAKAQMADIRAQLDSRQGGRYAGNNAELAAAYKIVQELRSTKTRLHNEKQALFAQRDAAREALNRIQNAHREMRKEIRYDSVDAIDNELRRLRHTQETESMTLAAEKRLIKEIEALQQSRKIVADLSEQKSSIDSQREESRSFAAQIASKKAEIDDVSTRLQAQLAVVERLRADTQEERAAIPALHRELQTVRQTIDGHYNAIRRLRTEFREKNQKFYKYQQAVRKLREETKRREAEERQRQYELELEEERRLAGPVVPYQAEINLCNSLISYLRLSFPAEADAADPTEAEEKKTEEVQAEEGFTIMRREEESYMVLGGGGKKKGKKGKRGRRAARQEITHSLDALESFASLGLSPPSTRGNVAASMEELNAKLASYQNAEPGTLPSADGGNSATTASANSGRGGAAGGRSKKGRNQVGDLTSDEQFPSLGGAAPPAAPSADEEGVSEGKDADASTNGMTPAELAALASRGGLNDDGASSDDGEGVFDPFDGAFDEDE